MNLPTATDPRRHSGDERTVHIPPRGAFGPPFPSAPEHQPGGQWPAAPVAGPGYAPGWPAAPAPPPWPAPAGRRRTLWIVAVAVLALVAVVIGAVVYATRGGSGPAPGTRAAQSVESDSPAPTSGAPAVPPVPVSALSGLLLSPPEAATVAGGDLAGDPVDGDRIFEAMADDPVGDQDCITLAPGKLLAYQGSGYTASRQQFLTGDPNRKIIQTVVSFATADAAGKYVADAKPQWDKCANRTVNLAAVGADNTRTSFWIIGNINDADGILSTTRVQEGGDGWVCQSGLAARNNIVIDFTVCGNDLAASVVPAFVTQVNTKIEEAK